MSAAFGEPLPCPDPMFTVDTNDDAMTRQLCTMATEIRGQLEGCGLKQSRALKIEIADEVSHPLASCLAYFDCQNDLVLISDPSTWTLLLEDDQPYASLPAKVALRALLTHEISHALITQIAGERKVPMVDQEYIAASMEIEFMEDAWRDVLLAMTPLELPPKEGLIDIWIYGFVPRKFGVNAWQHFSLPENGCSLIQKIAEGDASFSKSVRPELR
jgi:hypothetical protein